MKFLDKDLTNPKESRSESVASSNTKLTPKVGLFFSQRSKLED